MDEQERTKDFICMVGTDHVLAPADVRSAFVLPADVRADELKKVRDELGATGVALFTTCNRTELWLSFDGVETPERVFTETGAPAPDDPAFAALCRAHRLDPGEYARYFAARSGDAAVEHLYNVACGLRSAIVAEDQVISQVKQTITYARECDLADSCLEVLFRGAVTAAKHVKSGVRFTRAYATAVEAAMAVLEERGVDLTQARCMVIGNGEYGRLAASILAERGADVIITVRQYTHGYVVIPSGCGAIPYKDRYKHLASCDVVMSATTSPHYTLTPGMVDRYGNQDGMLIFDLAIPSDVSPEIKKLGHCEVFDIDSFSTNIGSENTQAIAQAERILEDGAKTFWSWVARRENPDYKLDQGAFFPLFVDISSKRVQFIGGGTIALRRIRTILPFAGEVDVVAPEVTPEVQQLVDKGAITLRRQEFDSSCLENADIVFACTNDSELNEQIADMCHKAGVMVSASSDRTLCDFYFPGVVRHDDIVVGISAGGKNHRRVRQLRQRIERLLEEEDI